MGEVFFALCKSIDSPLSLSCWIQYGSDQLGLAERAMPNPRDYNSADAFSKDYLVASLLKKFKGLKTGINKEDVALRKFTKSEEDCRSTNERFKTLASWDTPRLHSYLHAAQRKIARLLGPFSLFSVSPGYDWGPGATYELPRRKAHVDSKICELPFAVSRSALDSFRNEIERDLHWSAAILGRLPEGPYSLLPSCFSITEECKITTVDKDAKTDRVIAIEPRGNMFLQKGAGSYIRKRLRTVGVNLDDQGVNQELARRAYFDELATLDLRAASDTVSTELVYHLLPFEWFEFLNSVRSRHALMPDGNRVKLEKFSSMGNGFTFELESLIFWALCSAVRDSLCKDGVVAVYGDDLIVARSISTEVCLLLQFCGFATNDDKSFIDGPFFESCGKHYFMGVDVTPAYQKEEVEGSLTETIRLANRLIRYSFRLSGGKYLHAAIKPAWMNLRRRGGCHHLAIPFGLEGDDGWVVPYSEFPFSRWNFDEKFRCGAGFRVRVLSTKQLFVPANEAALLSLSLRAREPDALRRDMELVSGKGESLQDSLRHLGEAPFPYDGVVEIIQKPARLLETTRRVIPVGEFSAVWR